MELQELNQRYDQMQLEFGDPQFRSVYGAGDSQQPDTMFVFMNPTGRNVSTHADWLGMRAPWIGTKPIWRLFIRLGLLNEQTGTAIEAKHPQDWTPEFADAVYQDVTQHHYFMTNLAKCTFAGTIPVSNLIFREYLETLKQEVEIVQPKQIIAFGNQVSSILLGKSLSVSTTRQQPFDLQVGGHYYPVYPTYYPVGNGARNADKAIEDLMAILH
ncbi:uracil-DNA glycosylase family protein [Secundilactobacillus oryzae]|uniref:uracil-DNA glycosylase family protein n=1 Tax=Secundilactobacillus oryzae TaxID=1202668 RepID=UPI0005564285|nr:uracil-DNA glycosylase family protein [Secundilactobacillus oryzae]